MAGQPEDPQAFRIPEDAQQPVGPGPDPPTTPSFDPTRLDFGHYLRWLERHPSGVRYRAEIHRVLGLIPYSTDWRR